LVFGKQVVNSSYTLYNFAKRMAKTVMPIDEQIELDSAAQVSV
jgi:hypothetical protein